MYNDGLRARQEAYAAGLPYTTDAELSARLTASKATPARAWLSGVSAVVLQQALADLNVAYRNFFASLKGERKGPKVRPPRFRSRKDHRQSIRFTRNARFKVLPDGKLRLPGIGDVPVRWSRQLPCEPSSVTVIRDPAGQISPRRRLVGVRGYAGIQGPAVRADVHQDRPVRADLPHLLSMRDQGRSQAAARPRLAVPGMRDMAGPGYQRGGQRRQGRRAGGNSLQSAGKTRSPVPGAAQ